MVRMTDPAWPHIINFRDAGGCPGAGGRLVKKGLVFRGSHLNGAADDDMAKLAALNIGLVFDLRSVHEAGERPDRVPAGAQYRRVSGVPSMDHSARESLSWDELIVHLSSSDEALTAAETFQYGVYAEMIRTSEAFKALLGELLTHPGRPVFVHCSAGKDRTGVATAILLTLLGVSHDDVLADYLLSAGNPMPEAPALRERVSSMDPRIAKLITTMLTVSPWQLDLAFSEIDKAWGSWDGYVRDGLWLTEDDVTALREAMLA